MLFTKIEDVLHQKGKLNILKIQNNNDDDHDYDDD